MFYKSGKKAGKPICWVDRFPPSQDRAKLRSKTFPGIARAMAEQWAGQTQENHPQECNPKGG